MRNQRINDPVHIQKIASRIRRRNLKMLTRAQLGHPGGDLSVTDILAVLYFGVLNIDPQNPADPNRDRLVLSKGHAAGALYTTLAEVGFFPIEELDTFAQPLSRLNGHPARAKLPGVETSTGPLGHGLPFAVGAALAARMDGAAWRSFVITGDGELQEGSNWEAAMAAAQFQLDNLTLIIDRNGLQLGDLTENTIHLEPLAQKWAAFGWSVCEVDGHDIPALLDLLLRLPIEKNRPNCVIAHTHKGQGVSFMRDQPGWHHRVPTEAELALALEELGEENQ
ncbi:MAG: transketolase [Chloroflexi bacterium]|nr:MAG: transketolase [Chloroflexota bacterium]